MPEGLTQTETPPSPAGFRSECRPVSFRNRGRLQIGTVAGFTSEYPAGINRNPHFYWYQLLWVILGAMLPTLCRTERYWHRRLGMAAQSALRNNHM